MAKSNKQAYLHLHIAVFLFGFTPILGKLITLDQYNLVWLRMFLAGTLFLLVPSVYKNLKTFSALNYKRFIFIGAMVSLHWVAFYGSIKIGNSASLTLVCFSTITLFTAILEPLLLKHKFKIWEFCLGLLIIVGLYFVSQSNTNNSIEKGNFEMAIVWGIIASILAAFFSIYNKKWIGDLSTKTVTTIQLLGGWIFLSILLPILYFYFPKHVDLSNFQFIPSLKNLYYLLFLAIFCTILAFALELNALKKLSTFVANLVINLEPVYGIILAAILFKEHKMFNQNFFIGCFIILFSVFLHPLIEYYINRKKKKSLASISE